jgi:hypothetical protein
MLALAFVGMPAPEAGKCDPTTNRIEHESDDLVPAGGRASAYGPKVG